MLICDYFEKLCNLVTREKLSLNAPASTSEIEKLQVELGNIIFPEDLIDTYLLHDGQAVDAVPVFPGGYDFLPLSDVITVWRQLSDVLLDDPEFFWRNNWIPIAQSIGGGTICVVIPPHDNATVKIVRFFTTDDAPSAFCGSLSEYFQQCLQDIENGVVVFDTEGQYLRIV